MVHELGHFYGLPSNSSPNFIYSRNDPRANSSLDIGHCNDRLCMMEQFNVPNRLDLLQKTRYVINENPQLFCNYDLERLKNNLQKLYNE